MTAAQSGAIPAVMPTYRRIDIAFEKGDGVYLYGVDGRRYLDFACGIAVTAFGHCHPYIVKALEEQARKVWHVSNLHRIPEGEKLAQRLVEATFADTVFFTNSGTEAIEGTIKLVRKYQSAVGKPERYRLITFEGAFHGRSMAALAAGGQAKYLEGFGPPVDGFDQLPATATLKEVEAAIGDKTAGILIEPIQGEGGIRAFTPEFLRGLRSICDRHGLLLALDEIQTGMGRSGKLFAHEWADVKPDVMAVAKALGNGYPIGAFMATADAAQGMVPGTHGSTYGGNPLAMAIGNAVLDLMLAPGFLDRVQQVASHLRQSLAMLVDKNSDIFEEVRGQGLLLGLKCKPANGDVAAAFRKAGLLTAMAGDNVVRLLPPLIIEAEHIAEATQKIEAACADLRSTMKAEAARKAG